MSAAPARTHRAVQVVELSGPDGLRVVDVPTPDVGEGVLIEVHHAGVAFPDLLMSRGAYQRKPPVPFSPGVEVAGVVRAAPTGCHVRAGDRVAAFVRVGGWAELVVAAPGLVFCLPDDVSLRSGAGMPMNYLTAHLALTRRGGLSSGDVLLVHGAAGGLGTALVQVGKALGARVVAVTSTPEKAELARRCGADHTVPTDDWLVSARALLGPRGVHVVADTVGGDALLDSVRCLSKEGRVLVLGFASGTIPSVAASRLLLGNVDLRGVAWGSLIEDEPDYPAQQWADLMEWHAAGFIRPVDGRSFALAEAGDALRELDSRRALGKITLALGPADERKS